MKSVLEDWDVITGAPGEHNPPLTWASGPAYCDIPYAFARSVRHFWLHFEGIGLFQIAFPEKRIIVSDIAPRATQAAVEHILWDHVAPRVLAEQGALVLHASAVEIDGALAVFLGETGAGKSTLAASLHAGGHRLLGDDALVVAHDGPRPMGHAVYRTLRLYPEAIAAVLGTDVETTPMAHYSTKERVSLSAPAHADAEPVPIGAFFLLDADPAAQEIRCEPLTPGAACMAIVEHSFSLDPGDKRKAAERLNEASALAGIVPAYRLHYRHDFGRIPELHAAIHRCIAPLGRGRARGCKVASS